MNLDLFIYTYYYCFKNTIPLSDSMNIMIGSMIFDNYWDIYWKYIIPLGKTLQGAS